MLLHFAVSVTVNTTDDDDDDDDCDSEIILRDSETTCECTPFIISLIITILLSIPSWITSLGCCCKYRSRIFCMSGHHNIEQNGSDKENKSS